MICHNAVFDPTTRLAFASNGDGTLSIAQERSLQELVLMQVVPTRLGARTMALDPVTHKLYLVTADFAPQRDAIIPGSVRILVYAPN